MPTYNGFNTAMFRATVTAGAAAEADLDVPGINPGDVLLAVLHQDAEGLLLADLSAEASITEPDVVQLAGTDTTGDVLLTLWLDTSQPES